MFDCVLNGPLEDQVKGSFIILSISEVKISRIYGEEKLINFLKCQGYQGHRNLLHNTKRFLKPLIWTFHRLLIL